MKRRRKLRRNIKKYPARDSGNSCRKTRQSLN
jgi:hypothetical protein